MRKLAHRLPRVLVRLQKSHFDRYAFLRQRITESDVTQDPEFQRRFNGLYRLCFRSAEWRGIYYGLMERVKGTAQPDFAAILGELYDLTHRIEASFASKLVAIIQPKRAVYDSVLSRNLGLQPPKSSHAGALRIREFATLYKQLNERMNRLVKHSRFSALRCKLSAAFPGYSITSIRSLDLLLWQLRD